MKRFIYIAFVLLCVAFAGCKKDETDIGFLAFESDGLFVENYGDTITTTFAYVDVASIGVLSAPAGWDVEISLARRTVTATAPKEGGDGVEDFGMVTFYGFTPDGNSVADVIKVGKVPFVDLSDGGGEQANCFIVDKINTVYTFNPLKRGNEMAETLDVEYCEIVWRTSGMPIGYVHMYDNDRVGFHVNQDEHDLDYDKIEDELVEGNAVIAAYNSADEVVWSWHIWITESDPMAESFTAPSGAEFMKRNLGAFTNSNVSNATTEFSYDKEILRSYGLYYQWGRKDPFIYPSTYNAAFAADAFKYNDDGSYVPHKIISRSSTTGTIDYATRYPNNFISIQSNWLHSSHDDLWGEGTTKSVYDPSPKGWRVPSAEDFDGLNWESAKAGAQDLNGDRYGATIGGELFMALGLKAYVSGYTQNLSGDGSFKQWSGNYWCREADGADGDYAKMFNFYLDHENNAVVVDGAATSKRANALQIRCVKE